VCEERVPLRIADALRAKATARKLSRVFQKVSSTGSFAVSRRDVYAIMWQRWSKNFVSAAFDCSLVVQSSTLIKK
jgi:hypothetical protein